MLQGYAWDHGARPHTPQTLVHAHFLHVGAARVCMRSWRMHAKARVCMRSWCMHAKASHLLAHYSLTDACTLFAYTRSNINSLLYHTRINTRDAGIAHASAYKCFFHSHKKVSILWRLNVAILTLVCYATVLRMWKCMKDAEFSLCRATLERKSMFGWDLRIVSSQFQHQLIEHPSPMDSKVSII